MVVDAVGVGMPATLDERTSFSRSVSISGGVLASRRSSNQWGGRGERKTLESHWGIRMGPLGVEDSDGGSETSLVNVSDKDLHPGAWEWTSIPYSRETAVPMPVYSHT